MADDSRSPRDGSAAPALGAALAALWQRSVPAFLDRVAAVERGVAALRHGEFTPPLREEAEREAHRLVGALGTFGVPEGSRLARELERAFAAGATTDPTEAERLVGVAAELRRVVERRGAAE